MASDPGNSIAESVRRHSTCSSRRIARLSAAALAVGIAAAPGPASADQGGISFWLPGTFGSLAAVPGTPGWALGTVYYHTSVEAGGNVAASRSIRLGNRAPNLTVNLNANLDANADLMMFAPGYTFGTPVLGGMLTVNMLAILGRSETNIDATIAGALGPIGFAASRSIGDTVVGRGDLYPQVMLRWNQGVNNYMVYGMMNLPVGDYDPNRLANLGLGHWAIDGGVGYTYFNPQSGYEFSVVTGLTYNFENPYLDYQNGVSWHLDWGASKFLSQQFHIGLVGYAYQQITGDSGSGARLGPFESRVFAVGPQMGYLFPVAGMQGYLNLKGYGEFGAKNRPEGWNVWLTFALSPAAHPAPRPPVRTRF